VVTDASSVTPEAPGTDAPVVEEPKPILLWRPARFERQGQRRHDHRPRHGRGPAEAATEPGDRPAQQRQDGRPPFRGRREGGEGADSAGGKPKFDRSRFKGPPKPQGEGGRPDYQKSDFRKGKREDGRNENRGPKPAFQPRPREERPAKVDPLSPFAKLAALRDQLQPKK
jgi:ATP-dependent RNA helicase SUPV3L1/SUV3